MSKRAVIYARVSTDEQRGNYSVTTQIADCLKLAKDKGYTIVGDRYINPETGFDTNIPKGAIAAFVDDFSSRELSRPGLDGALAYLEAVGFDVLIIHAIDRLARDPHIRYILEREFTKQGVTVEYFLGRYDNTPEGEVRKDLDATFSKWENAKRVERCNRGKRGKAENGLFVGGPTPYGYLRDNNALGGLGVVDREAEIVDRIFCLYVVDHCSLRGVAELLNSEGIPSHSGTKGSWGKSSIHKILTNETYVGRWYYNKYQIDRSSGKTKLVLRDRSEWIEVAVTPIIAPGMFKRAQELLGQGKEERRKEPKRFYLLGSMVYCGECEKPYGSQTAQAGKRRRKVDSQSYRHRVKEGHCYNRQLNAKVIEAVVWQEIHKLLDDPETLNRGYNQSIEQQHTSYKRQRSQLEQLCKRQSNLEETRDNLTKAYIDPEIGLSKREYTTQKTRIDQELKEIYKSIHSLEKELENLPTPASLATMQAFADEVRPGLRGKGEALTPEEKRRIYELLHLKVFIGQDDKVKITGWIEPISTRLSSITSAYHGQQPVTFCLFAKLG